MVNSMTAYANAESRQSFGHIKCEIKSINHRYLDLSFRLPERLRHLEFTLRELAKHYLHRGKVECLLHWETDQEIASKSALNLKAVKQLADTYQEVYQVFQTSSSSTPITLPLMDILNWPSVYKSEDNLGTIDNQAFIDIFTQTLKKLVSLRSQEGSALAQVIFQRLDTMAELTNKIKSLAPTLLQSQRDKIYARLNDLKIDLNSDRLEQEMVYFAQKIDISEEIDRLLTHIDTGKQILNQGGVVGRQLDFLLQELNREANTLTSKSLDIQVIQMGMEIKLLIEQIREQVQNLE